MRRVAALAVLAVASGVLQPAADAVEPRRHVVKAGSEIPGGGPEPFSFTAFYPPRLQVHRGDTVEWQFPGSYGGWHTVSFADPGGVVPQTHRTDEYEDFLAITEELLLGHEWGDTSSQCGSGQRYGMYPPGPPCRLGITELSGPLGFSSSILDRFFGTGFGASTFTVEIGDLPDGEYRYRCRVHPGMEGVVEVVPDDASLSNPTAEDVSAAIQADFEAAQRRVAELEDPETAWDGTSWTVRAGTEAAAGRVQIFKFLPSVLTGVRPGDKVRFVAEAREANSVAFPPDLQGGFNLGGSCDADDCSTGVAGLAQVPPPLALPWGEVGGAFPFGCDYDEPASGSPGVLLSYDFLPDPADPSRPGACLAANGLRGTPEMLIAPFMASPHPAPGNVVASRITRHSSGMMLPSWLPPTRNIRPDTGKPFIEEFEAVFPAPGSFPYACLNHEGMRGTVVVG